MTPTLLQKELRTLAFPAGVALSAILAGVWAATVDGLGLNSRILLTRGAMFAFFIGTPLLAALPFGAEFQHKTIVLLLSAPVSRGRIWLEKWVAATAVLATLTAFVLLVFSLLHWPINVWPIVPALMFMVMAACAAPLWTLIARSTIGGLAFTLSTILMLELAATYVTFRLSPGRETDLFGWSPMLVVVRALYAVVTLYAGYVVFSRFQVAATGVAAASAAQAGTGVAVLRARPSGAIANIVRKELMLQRPAFLMAALFTAGGIVSVALIASGALSIGVAQALPMMLLAGYMPLVIVLAGTIPVGEETSLGIRDWHLTLPVSARTQWWLKLLVAVGVVVLLGLVLPGALTAIANRITGGRFGDAAMFRAPSFQLLVIGATLLAFWSSTMFGETLRSSVATGAAIIGIGACVALAAQIADWIPLRQSWWVPITARYQLPSFYVQAVWVPRVAFVIGTAAMLAVGLPQSYAAFRRVRLNRQLVIRNCVVLMAAALTTFTFNANLVVSSYASRFPPGRELREAVMRLPGPADETPGRESRRRVTLEELDRARPLSPDTWRWLAGATITVERVKTRRTYLVLIRFPNGSKDGLFINPADR